MQLGLGQELVEFIVTIEVALILFVIVLTYVTKYILYLREQRRLKLMSEIETHFKNLVASKQPVSSQKFHRRWRKIQILYTVFVKLDQQYKSSGDWAKLKNEILQTILHPLAVRRAYSRRWVIRFFACETLGLTCTSADEKIILRLIKDRIPLVYLHAITAAIKSGSEAAITAIIVRMSKMSWLTQNMYLEPFENAAISIRDIIEKQLKTSTDSNIRTECYKILRKFPATNISWDIKKDLNDRQFELRLSSLKYYVYVDSNAAVPVLQEKLRDEHWEVRLVAIHRLGRLKLASSLPDLTNCLSDSVWYVKISAAEALKSLGAEGINAIKSHAPELADIPFDSAHHVSNTLW